MLEQQVQSITVAGMNRPEEVPTNVSKSIKMFSTEQYLACLTLLTAEDIEEIRKSLMTTQQNGIVAETQPQLLARLLRSGGRILVVGGGVNDLGEKFTKHPGLIFWDDHDQSHEHKEVPSNVRAILWNRWISHSTAGRLHVAAEKLRVLKFPMLRTRGIKELLSEIVQEAPATEITPLAEPASDPVLTEALHQQDVREAAETASEKDTTVAKKTYKKGSLTAFIAKNLDLKADFSARGSIGREADRLKPLFEKEGGQTTEMSIRQAVGQVVKGLGKKTSRGGSNKRKTTAPTTTTLLPKPKESDDFVELERLVEDAITALKLVAEHLPKVRKDVEKTRAARAKMLAFLGVEE